jgi:hypothetical protein
MKEDTTYRHNARTRAHSQELTYNGVFSIFFLIHRFHSISFTRAQGIPMYKIGFGREKDGRVGERLD